MNHFLDKFNDRIRSFWANSGESEKRRLLRDILIYANSDKQTFTKEIEEIRFDRDLLPLPIVLEALSKDTANWGQFYVDLLDDLFETAKQVENPNEILTYLNEFAYIEDDDKPFVQKIVDRLLQELRSENLETKLAAIYTLPNYLDNKVLENRSALVRPLQQLLTDKNWKVRVATFQALGFEDLIPSGHKLAFKDKLFKLILGDPRTF